MNKTPIETLETRRLMATFTVTNTLDSGAGSLRDAILQANATTAADVIQFVIPLAASKTITPVSALPGIFQPLTIDATTQPGYAGFPLITLDGSSTPDGTSGFNIQANDVLIRGMAIGGFDDNALTGGRGVVVGLTALRATIRDCYVGLAANGLTALPNHIGIRSAGGNTQVIDSVVSGNERHGVWFSEDGGKVLNSTVGLSRSTNVTTRPNGEDGVRIDGGTFGFVEDSVVSGNVGYGVHVLNSGTTATVNRNIIGMNSARTSRFSNGAGGVFFNGSTGNITSNRIASFNLVSVGLQNANGVKIEGNNIGFGVNAATPFGGSTGIKLDNADNNTIRLNQIGHQTNKGIHLVHSDNNSIRYNGIGTLIDNSLDLGNVNEGIHIVNGFDNKIGTDGEGNTISFNGSGIYIESGERNPTLANRFKNNFGLDIDLGDFGVTDNDGNDADTGANTLLNTIVPVWGAYNSPANPGQTTVSFRARSEFASGGTYRIDFYRSDTRKEPFDIGEGSALIDSQTITMPDGDTDFLFYTEVPIEIDGNYIAATVTTLINGVPVNTSEISQAMRVRGAPQILSSQFNFETRQEVAFNFSRSVAGSIGNNEITVRNLATNQTYTPSGFTLLSSQDVSWHFSTPLPDGNYRATLDRNSVSSPVEIGTTQVILNAEGPNTLDFHVLSGDADRDRDVDFNDLVTLARNYGQAGLPFSEGNFDYSADGLVGFNDLVLLARNYGKTLPSSPIASAPVASSVFSNRSVRSDVLNDRAE